jgi:putative polyketide hydroxylase
MYDDDKTQVLVVVVGGALTGLSSAVFLAAHGVPCVVVVKRHHDLLIHPLGCAASTRARSSCFARSDWSPPSAGGKLCEQSDRYAFAPIRAETLADEEYTPRNRRGGRYNSSDPDPASPSAFGAIDQDKKLEILLRDRARELGAVTYGSLWS